MDDAISDGLATAKISDGSAAEVHQRWISDGSTSAMD